MSAHLHYKFLVLAEATFVDRIVTGMVSHHHLYTKTPVGLSFLGSHISHHQQIADKWPNVIYEQCFQIVFDLHQFLLLCH